MIAQPTNRFAKERQRLVTIFGLTDPLSLAVAERVRIASWLSLTLRNNEAKILKGMTVDHRLLTDLTTAMNDLLPASEHRLIVEFVESAARCVKCGAEVPDPPPPASPATSGPEIAAAEAVGEVAANPSCQAYATVARS